MSFRLSLDYVSDILLKEMIINEMILSRVNACAQEMYFRMFYILTKCSVWCSLS